VNTRLNETEEGWALALNEARLGYLHVDFRLGLDIADASGTVNLTIETPCRLSTESCETILSPDDPPSVAPILALFNADVGKMFVQRTGHLAVEFANGYRLNVSPNDEYEAWQIACKNEFLMVCAPGGMVTVFRE